MYKHILNAPLTEIVHMVKCVQYMYSFKQYSYAHLILIII